MTFNQTSSIRFSVEESVWFKKGQEVAQVLSMSLDPEISIQEHENYISIRGALVLTGEYYPNASLHDNLQSNEPELYSLRETAALRTVDEIRENEAGIHSMKHRFPVDITIPTNRIRSLEDVYIMIEAFDYEIPDNGRLELKADLAISGIVNERATANSQSVAVEANKENDNKVETVSNAQVINKANENLAEPISAVRGSEGSEVDNTASTHQPAVSASSLKAESEEKVLSLLRGYQENVSVKEEEVMDEKFPSFTTEARKEAENKDSVDELQEAVNIVSIGDSVSQLEVPELTHTERIEEQQIETDGQVNVEDEIPVVIGSKQSSPQIGMKGRSEQQGYAWNPKSLYSSHGTFNSSALPDKNEYESATSEKPIKKSITRSENALYLTKMLSTDGEQDFSKLRVRIVQQGESLGTIAASYEVSASQIMRMNGLVDDVLEEGQILYIPEYVGVQ